MNKAIIIDKNLTNNSSVVVSGGITGSSATINGTLIIYAVGSPSYNYFATTSTTGINSALYSTSYGYDALKSITTGGQHCTAVGYSSLKNSTTGKWNTSIGSNALGTVSTNNNNTACGYSALSNCTSNQNCAVGGYVLGAVSTGGANTGIGYQAGTCLTLGQNNTFLGAQAGNNAATLASSNCTYVGYATMNPSDYSNSTAIGYNATITAANQIQLGTATENVNILGTLTTAGVSNFNANKYMNNNLIYLRSSGTANTNTYYLGYNATYDGPALFGYTGGVLGYQSNYVMSWNANGVNLLTGLNLGVSVISGSITLAAPYSCVYILNSAFGNNTITLPTPTTNLTLKFRRVASNTNAYTLSFAGGIILATTNASATTFTVSNVVELVYYSSNWYILNAI
jgi:hypothetical protein